MTSPSADSAPNVARRERPARAGSPARTAAVAGGLALGVVTWLDATSRGVPVEIASSVLLGYSWAYIAAGWVAWLARPESRSGLILVGIGTGGATLLGSNSLVPVLDLLPLVGVPVMNALVIWLVLSYPEGRLRSRADLAAVVAVGVVVAANNALFRTVGPSVLPYGAAVMSVVALATLVLVVVRWRSASPTARRIMNPMVVAGVLVAVLFTGESVTTLLGIPNEFGTPFRWTMLGARAAVPVAIAIGLLRMRIARAAVADLMIDLDLGRVAGLRDRLAAALGDPSLQLVLWSRHAGRFVDDRGQPVDLSVANPERRVVVLERAGEPLGAIVHDPALAADPGLVSAVAASVRMAADNQRLTDEVRAQLEEVRASRQRIVEAGDAERRRVERNLHDGAQQRLVALSLALRRARAQLPDNAGEAATTLDEAANQLRAALEELRTLARGIHPAVLTEAGLDTALRALVRESPVPVELVTQLDDKRLPDNVKATAYFVTAEALANVAKYAQARSVQLTAVAGEGRLRIEVVDDGLGGADPNAGSGLRGIADRLAAHGGTLAIDSPRGLGTKLVADVPIAPTANA